MSGKGAVKIESHDAKGSRTWDVWCKGTSAIQLSGALDAPDIPALVSRSIGPF